jgi:hypothetical protein
MGSELGVCGAPGRTRTCHWVVSPWWRTGGRLDRLTGHAYLKIAPALEPYFSTGHHDDEQGLAASYLLAGRGGPRLWRWGQFLVNTPTIVATVDAALAAAIVVLVVWAAEAATTVVVVAGAVAFLIVWAALFLLRRRALDPLRRTTPRFPTPPDEA